MEIDHSQIKELEYNEITDGVYIGTNQCCQTHFDEKLRKEGITSAAIYEHFWIYPFIKKASYSVGPDTPTPLNTRKKLYSAKLTLVDYDGCVSHISQKSNLYCNKYDF